MFQSGFNSLHSTKLWLLKVLNELLFTIDAGDCAILVLLHSIATFDTIDHSKPSKRLVSFAL